MVYILRSAKNLVYTAVMSQSDAAARVRRRLNEWADRVGRHGATTALAKAVPGKYGKPMSVTWASGIITGKQDLRLADLDAVAELLGVPPGDLVRRNHDHYLEVIPSEMRFLQHIRRLPDTIRQHWLAYLDYVFGFQDALLTEHKTTIDKRTKLARLARERQRREPPA